MSELNLAILVTAFLGAHELDAVACREWRLLYVLRDMPEERAAAWFVALHVPMFAAFGWMLTSPSASALWTRQVVAAFAIVHALLHYRLRRHPEYRFHSLLSRAIIVGAALAGMAQLLLFSSAAR